MMKSGRVTISGYVVAYVSASIPIHVHRMQGSVPSAGEPGQEEDKGSGLKNVACS